MLPKINSAHGSDTRNIINRAIEVLNVQGKAIQDLVAEGQLTEEQYAELITVINGLVKSGDIDKSDFDIALRREIESFRKKGESINLNDLSPAVLEAIDNGEGTTFEILSIPRPKSVTPSTTTFIEIGSSNIFNPETVTHNKVVRGVNGGLLDSENFHSSDYIQITPDTDFTFSNVVFVAYYDKDGTFIVRTEIVGGGIETLKSPDNAHILRVSYRPNQVVQINEGSELLPYEDFKYNFVGVDYEIQDGEISKEKVSFVNSQVVEGEGVSGLINKGGSEITALGTTTTENVFAHVFPIEYGKSYDIFKKEGGNRFTVMLVDQDPRNITSDIPVLYSYLGDFSSKKQKLWLHNSHNGKYMVVITNFKSVIIPEVEVETSTLDGVGLEVGSVHEDHLSNNLKEKINRDNENKELTKNYAYNFYVNLNELYIKDETLEGFPTNPETMTVEEYHTMFGDLISGHNNATRELLGTVFEEEYPIYQYEITPPEYKLHTDDQWGRTGGHPMRVPKVLITTGIHGKERGVSYSAYYLLKEILENPSGNDLIEFLKMHIHLICIPIANPDGWTQMSYGNRNHANLNSTFPPAGVAAQTEAGILKEVVDSNSDLDLHIDFHNMGFRDGRIGYTMTTDDLIKNTYSNMYKMLGRQYQKKYSQFPQDINHVWAHNSIPNNGTVARYSEREYGITATTLEVIDENLWIGDGKFGESVVRMGVDYLVNAITGTLRSKF